MKPLLIDSHSHLNFNAYKDDGTEVIHRALDKNIWMVTVGSQFTTSRRALRIANDYPAGVYAAIGLHPIHISSIEVDEEEIKFKTAEEKFDKEKYQELIDDDKNKKIVAIGEIGLDFYHIPKDRTLDEIKKEQAQEFTKQLKFAHKNNLPVILHCRGSKSNPLEAYNDLLDIIKSLVTDYGLRITGVIHCFGGDISIARQFIKLNFYIGFTGIITFGKNADSLRQVVKDIPLEKILVETDAPYLAPEPQRGKRNEPAYVEFVARKIAEIKKVDYQEVADITTQNAKKLFNIS
jgi:TatD DNase family protein